MSHKGKDLPKIQNQDASENFGLVPEPSSLVLSHNHSFFVFPKQSNFGWGKVVNFAKYIAINS